MLCFKAAAFKSARLLWSVDLSQSNRAYIFSGFALAIRSLLLLHNGALGFIESRSVTSNSRRAG
jgi:hypothetical protein